MPSFSRNEKVVSDNCGTQTTKLNLARHKKWCSVGILYCTQCPNFSTKSQKIWIIILPENTAPQNLMSPWNVNFVIKNFQDFTLYVNIETLNTECSSVKNKRCECGTHSGTFWGSQLQRRVAFSSTFLGEFRNWQGETQSIQLRSGNCQRNNRERKIWSIFQRFEMPAKI